MARLHKYLLLVITLTWTACSRDSSQLPHAYSPLKTLSLPVYNNGVIVATVNLSQATTPTTDTVHIDYTHLTGPTKLRIITEFCKATAQTYSSCDINVTDTVSFSESLNVKSKIILINHHIILSDSLINTYLIDCYDGTTGINGYYNAGYSLFRKDFLVTSYPQIYGFVTCDGTSTFRIKASDSLYYNIVNARFSQSNFAGGLNRGGEIVSYLALDSFIANKPDSAIFKLNLTKALEDSTNNLLIYAHKF